MDISRRILLALSLGLFRIEGSRADNYLREEIIGDPGSEVEDINLSIEDIVRVEELTRDTDEQTRDVSLYPVIASDKLFLRALKVAQGEADAKISRTTNRARVEEYLGLFGLSFSDPATQKPYAFCACGLSWAIANAYCDLAVQISGSLYKRFDYSLVDKRTAFQTSLKGIRSNYLRPHPQVEVMAQDARDRKIWRSNAVVPMPGWIVFYNWSGGARGEHIGIVESASRGKLSTVEFNTSIRSGSQINGGVVARKDRTDVIQRVLGYAATY